MQGHEFIWVPSTGPYIQQVKRALYRDAPGVPVEGGYKQGGGGGKAPKSRLSD
jgi:hypothetical protein